MKDSLRAFLARLIPKGSIAEQTIKSGLWMTAIKITNRPLQILMLIVLARFLTPRDFGLVGIALLALVATQRFTKIGLNAALIHEKSDNIDSYLNTTWCLEAGRGILLFIAMFAAAPYLARFFGEPQAEPLVQVIALIPLIYGVRNPAIVYFKKDLSFHKEFVYQTSGGVVQFAVGVGYALYSPTAWALVFAYLSAEVARTTLSYVMLGYRPWPSFDLQKAGRVPRSSRTFLWHCRLSPPLRYSFGRLDV